MSYAATNRDFQLPLQISLSLLITWGRISLYLSFLAVEHPQSPWSPWPMSSLLALFSDEMCLPQVEGWQTGWFFYYCWLISQVICFVIILGLEEGPMRGAGGIFVRGAMGILGSPGQASPSCMAANQCGIMVRLLPGRIRIKAPLYFYLICIYLLDFYSTQAQGRLQQYLPWKFTGWPNLSHRVAVRIKSRKEEQFKPLWGCHWGERGV